MALALLIAIQAAAATPPAAAAVQIPQVIDFDLARLRVADADADVVQRPGCARADPAEILVCGQRPPSAYPLEQWARIFEPRPLVAERRLFGNAVGRLHGETAVLDRGAVSQRVLVSLLFPF